MDDRYRFFLDMNVDNGAVAIFNNYEAHYFDSLEEADIALIFMGLEREAEPFPKKLGYKGNNVRYQIHRI